MIPSVVPSGAVDARGDNMLTQYKMDSATAKLMRRRAGGYIRSLRQEAELTQQQVAKHLGYDYYTFISQVELGYGRVPSEDLAKWAEVLRVEKGEFAKRMLSFYDPYLYYAIFGGQHPIEEARRWKEANAKVKSTGRASRSSV
jgi:transcriptional regulator with XRE-family HTH domain